MSGKVCLPIDFSASSCIGVLGFGVDGQCVAEWVAQQQGIDRILIFDDLAESGEFECGTTLDGVDLLFRSPGFPLTHSLVKEAKDKKIPITSSTAQVLQHFKGITIGVTGSNGKTTCTALIVEFLKAEFGETQVERGGNDGVPQLDLINGDASSPLRSVQHDTFLVLELSSFQLIDCPVSPNVAVVLNVSPNHLDWHADMNEYAEAKRQIVVHQCNTVKSDRRSASLQGDIAVLNSNDPIVKSFAKGLQSEVHWFADDIPLDQVRCKTHPDTIRAAVTAARALNVSERNILKVLKEFPGVPHRLEFIRELDGIKWYNDSSCTTPESAIAACEAFPKGSLTILIGGRDKGMDFGRLYKVIKERDVIVVPYGEMAEELIKNVPSVQCVNIQAPEQETENTKMSFEEVIETARGAAGIGMNIVLSPACASFDMFKNAKERGIKFTEIVMGL